MTITGSSDAGIDNTGFLTITDSTIAGGGPGVENIGTLTITNSTIAGCGGYPDPAQDGGIDNFGTLTAVNTTIAYNAGAGLYDEPGASSTLDNTIVALNQYYNTDRLFVQFDDIAGAPVSSASADNLIGTGGAGGLSDGSNGNLVDMANPGLAAPDIVCCGPANNTPLATNGGPTQTIALLPGSPALGAGSTALADEYGLTTDQRGVGFPRSVAGSVDIGAFESPVFSNPTVYTVNLTTDTGAASGMDAATGTPSGDLLWAITQANANTNPAGSLIQFDPTVFNAASPTTIILTGSLDLSESPWPEVIQGPGANVLTLMGNNSFTVLQVAGDTTATLSGLTISGGNGGINNSGTLTVADCTIAGNSFSAWGGGGGIANGGFLTVSDSTIEDNSAAWGGGINNINVMTLTDCTIAGNSVAGAGGGFNNQGVATVSDSTIAGNSAFLGGGECNQSGVLRIIGSTIDDNSASSSGTGAWGGGLLQSDRSQWT